MTINERQTILKQVSDAHNLLRTDTLIGEYKVLAEQAAGKLGSTLTVLRTAKRDKRYAWRRMIIAEMLFECGCSIPTIAKIFGKDRTTVYTMLANARNWAYLDEVQLLKQMIK